MKKTNTKIIYFILPIITIVFVISFFVYLFFKYSGAIYYNKSAWDYNYSSSNVYISSNMLDERMKTTQMLNYDYTNIPFSVYNYASETQISKKNISYGITCTTNQSNYSCIIDDTSSSITNQTLQKSYRCSVQGYTEEQCANDPQATLTYEKVPKNHTIKVQKTSGSDASYIEATITLTTTSPYEIVLVKKIKMYFDNTRKGVVITKLADSTHQCEYIVSNYTDSNSITLTTNSNTIVFMDNKSTSYTINLDKYSEKTIKVFKKASDSCTGAVTSS